LRYECGRGVAELHASGLYGYNHCGFSPLFSKYFLTDFRERAIMIAVITEEAIHPIPNSRPPNEIGSDSARNRDGLSKSGISWETWDWGGKANSALF